MLKLSEIKLNRVVRYLTLSEIILQGSWGLLDPFIAIFITSELTNGSVEAAGFAATIYLVLRGVLQLPVARYLDRNPGEKDDFIALVLGTFISSVSAFLFLFATDVVHVYIIQALTAVGASLSFPAWYALFTRHVDRKHEAFQWSFYDTSVSLAAAITASVGGLMIVAFGYEVIFVIVGVANLIATVVILVIRGNLKQLERPEMPIKNRS